MGRRYVYYISILLFCLLSGSCGNKRNELENSLNEKKVIPESKTPEETAEDNTSDVDIETLNPKVEGDSSAMGKEQEETKLQGNNGVIEAATLGAYTTQEELIMALRQYPAGTELNMTGVMESRISQFFYMEELSDEVKERISGKSYGENCELPYEELRYIRVLYCAFDGTTRIGELIVNQAIAQDILDIFRELYGISYPIEQMLLIDEYDADDEKSMEANNSSAFNYRFVAGTTRLSKHSLGWAIDINPLYNPYITTIDGKKTILPENGSEYADRTKDCPYYIKEGDACYEAFISRGFTWGGDWKNSKDYQHFEKIVE